MSSCFFDALVRRLGGWGEGAVIPVVDCGCISEVYAPGEHPPHIRDSPGISI